MQYQSNCPASTMSILSYLHQRFPLIPVFLFALGYSSLALGAGSTQNIWFSDWKLSAIRLLLFTSIFIFFLLRQRVIDEFKDFTHDLEHFPDRPFPRGLISKRQLILVGGFALTAELGSVFLLGVKAVTAYIPVFLYSLLMAKEFFAGDWFNRHFTLYFLTHEVIFVLFGIFFLATLNQHPLEFDTGLLLAIGILTAAPMSIEIVRKFSPRSNKKGEIVEDTYSTVWGRRTTLFLLIVLTLFIGLACMTLKKTHYFLFYSIGTTIALLILGYNSDKEVTGVGAISFLGFALLTNLIW